MEAVPIPKDHPLQLLARVVAAEFDAGPIQPVGRPAPVTVGVLEKDEQRESLRRAESLVLELDVPDVRVGKVPTPIVDLRHPRLANVERLLLRVLAAEVPARPVTTV